VRIPRYSLSLFAVFMLFAAPVPVEGRNWTTFWENEYKKWEPLAKNGHTLAQIRLGHLYNYGHGVPQNYETAVRWYGLSYSLGNHQALHNLRTTEFKLGTIYERGIGVPQNYETALRWYTLSAKHGNSPALQVLDMGILNEKIENQESSPPSPSAAEIENQKLRKENDGIESRSSERSIASRLSILKELQDAGLITKAEAATKRKVILDSL
jgi:hypothetical protein